MTRNSELLASWYLRLNGCFLIPNYIFHALDGRQRAEVDLMAVRFPHRAEMRDMGYVLLDDAVFPREPRLIDVMLAEVKTGKPCTVNSTLLSLATRNMEYALDAIGAFPEAEQGSVADALRSSGAAQDARMRIRLFAFGAKPNKTLGRRLPAAVQLTWPDVLTFIHRRFTSRSSVANYHDQWDDYGRTLWVNAQRTRDAFLETTIAALSGDSDNVSATAATHGRDPRN